MRLRVCHSPLLWSWIQGRRGSSCHCWCWERRVLWGWAGCLGWCGAPVRSLLGEDYIWELRPSCPWCCGCTRLPPGRPPVSPCSTSPPGLCCCSCTGISQSLQFKDQSPVELHPADEKTFLEVADSQSARRGERDEGKKRRGEKSFNDGDVPAQQLSQTCNSRPAGTCTPTHRWALVCQRSWDWAACSQSWCRWRGCCSPGWSSQSWCPCWGPASPRFQMPSLVLFCSDNFTKELLGHFSALFAASSYLDCWQQR